MHLLEVDNVLGKVIFGIVAMVLLFASFLISFINSQRKKIIYHKSLQSLYEDKQRILTEQNELLEKRVEEKKVV